MLMSSFISLTPYALRPTYGSNDRQLLLPLPLHLLILFQLHQLHLIKFNYIHFPFPNKYSDTVDTFRKFTIISLRAKSRIALHFILV